jgi:hypothetical protein
MQAPRIRLHHKSIASAAIAVIAFALSLLGVPKLLAWVLLGAGVIGLVVALLLLVRERGQKPKEGERPPRPRGVSEAEWLASRAASQEAARALIADFANDPPSSTLLTLPPAETVDANALAEARELIEPSRGLKDRVWEGRRRALRSLGFAILPSDLVAEIREWNGRVLALADECLNAREAGDVSTYPALMGNFAGADILASLIQNNRAVLSRLIAAGERQGEGT